MDPMADSMAPLRYVEACLVDTGDGELDHVAVQTADATTLGRLAGFLVDPVSRRLRYLVVESGRWLGRAMRLVPFSIAWIDRPRRTLHVDLSGDPRACCPAVNRAALSDLFPGRSGERAR